MKFGFGIKAFSTIALFTLLAPMVALFSKVSWAHFFDFASAWHAMWLSLWSSLFAALISILLGVPLAWTMAKGRSRFLTFLRPLVLSPIVIPPTVAGMALLSLYGRTGLLGKYVYEGTGYSIPFTTPAVLLAGVFVGLPFVILICESSFRDLPQEVEEAAIIDRAKSAQIFRIIALPQISGALVTSALLAWARAIGEFGATLMFSGSLPGSTQTWTMLIYQEFDIDPQKAYGLSAIMLLMSFAVVFAVRKSLLKALR